MKKEVDKILEDKNKETIKHLMTVLSCFLEDAKDYQEEAVKYSEIDKLYSEEMYSKSYEKWDEAEKYLRDYLNKDI